MTTSFALAVTWSIPTLPKSSVPAISVTLMAVFAVFRMS